MKFLITFLIVLLGTVLNAQVDNSNSSNSEGMAIPAVEPVEDNVAPTPSYFDLNKKESKLDINKYFGKINLSDPFAKKEKPMEEDRSEFLDPGEFYKDNLKKQTLKGESKQQGFTSDRYLGDLTCNAKSVRIVCRDHQYPDGDLIRVHVNDEVVVNTVLLEGFFKEIKFDLVNGFNKVDFEALNQGESGPNTAEFIVYDEKGNVLSSNQWLLKTGIKATLVIIKEEN